MVKGADVFSFPCFQRPNSVLNRAATSAAATDASFVFDHGSRDWIN
jgi:hypothetical protein